MREEALQALGPAVGYHHRRTIDELDRKVIAHVQEYGRITNKTVRNIERRPTVDYGPGPKFPAKKRRRASNVQ